MLWLATFSTLLAFFAAFVNCAEPAIDKELTKNELVEGISDEEARTRVLDKLNAMPSEDVKTLHDIFCVRYGKCMSDAAALLVNEYKRFVPEGEEVDIGAVAMNFKQYFLDYAKKLGGDAHYIVHSEQLGEEKFLTTLGGWYRTVAYTFEKGSIGNVLFCISMHARKQ